MLRYPTFSSLSIKYLSPPPLSLSQDTLEEASALLKEIEARDSRQAAHSSGDSKHSSENSSELSSNTQHSNMDRLEG